MHEIDLAADVVRLACDAAPRQQEVRVLTVNLKVGRLAGVEGGALLAAFDVASRGTILEGSRLAIRDVPVVIWCAHCLDEVELAGVQRFRCPRCGVAAGEIRHGKELEIESLEIEA